jgi:hypothetical protein
MPARLPNSCSFFLQLCALCTISAITAICTLHTCSRFVRFPHFFHFLHLGQICSLGTQPPALSNRHSEDLRFRFRPRKGKKGKDNSDGGGRQGNKNKDKPDFAKRKPRKKRKKHKDKTKGREDRADPKEALYELRGSVYRQAGSGQPFVDVRFAYIKGLLLLLLLLLCPVQNNKAEAHLLASCCHALGHHLRL